MTGRGGGREGRGEEEEKEGEGRGGEEWGEERGGEERGGERRGGKGRRGEGEGRGGETRDGAHLAIQLHKSTSPSDAHPPLLLKLGQFLLFLFLQPCFFLLFIVLGEGT